MSKVKIPFLALLFFFTFFLTSCSDDDFMTDPMEEEMEEEQSVDITTNIVGMYLGDSEFTQGGSSFTEDNRSATVTRSTDSTATISITSVGGAITLNATLDSDSTFSVESDLIFDEGPFTGVGSIEGAALLIEVSTENSINFGYEAVRQ